MPLRYTMRDTATMVTRSVRCLQGAGRNALASTALGMTDTLEGGMPARSTVFSLLLCETQMTCKLQALFCTDGFKNKGTQSAERMSSCLFQVCRLQLEHVRQHSNGQVAGCMGQIHYAAADSKSQVFHIVADRKCQAHAY